MISFKSKKILIAGAGSGIGRAMAQALDRLDASLVLVGRRKDKLEETLNLLKNKNQHQLIPADIATHAEQIANELKNFTTNIDGFIQNAAIFPKCEISSMADDQWSEVIHTNLNGSFFLLKRLIPFLKKSHSPRVLFTSSVAGNHVGTPTLSAYAASKAGLKGLVTTAALELAPFGILINAIEPGPIATEFRDNPEGRTLIEDLSEGIPLKRFGKPEEIAHFAAFLVSEENSFMTGQTVVVDGGLSILDIGGMRYYRLNAHQ